MSDAEEETNQSVSAPTGNQSHRISLVFFDLTLNFPPGCRPVRLFQVFLKLCDVSVAKISSGQDQQTFFPSVWSQSATNFGVKKRRNIPETIQNVLVHTGKMFDLYFPNKASFYNN